MQETRHGGMPAGIWNAHLFQVFNTISWSIVLSMPMVLYFKHLHASATVLGVVVALNPLLNILQIPAAKFVERVGYRAFVLRGWASRSFFIVGMAIVAALPEAVGREWRIALMLLMLAGFNSARGISVCGFLPWLTLLVPEPVRGRFLARDQIAGSAAIVGTMLMTAGYLTRAESRWSFAIIFLASYLGALVSLIFLRRIPDVPVPHGSRSTTPVPWREMLLYPPFRSLMIYNFVVCVAYAAAGVFWVPLLRDAHGASDAVILEMTALSNGVMVICLLVFGRLIDRTGSRPMLAVSAAIYVLHFSGWCALAAGVLPFNLKSVLFLQITAGLGVSLFNLANTRLVMGIVPEMGRSHFFALFSVITSLTLGSLPVVWGAGLDLLAGWHARWGAWDWNRYSVLYAALVTIMLVSHFFRVRVPEPQAMTTDAFLQELVLRTPVRGLSRLLARRPFS